MKTISKKIFFFHTLCSFSTAVQPLYHGGTPCQSTISYQVKVRIYITNKMVVTDCPWALLIL